MTNSIDDVLRCIRANSKCGGAEELITDEILHSNLRSNSRSLPPILIAHYEEPLLEITQYAEISTPSYPESFEKLTLALRSKALSIGDNDIGWIKPQPEMKTVEASDIAQAIRMTCLDQSHANTGSDPKYPPNLKLVGLKINGDLDLSKLDIPYSVRLICCWVTGSLILDRSKLSTLDISGSIFENGISASYLSTEGSVRMRRTVSLGPVDFAGLKVGATFDASDAIVVPRYLPSNRTSFVGDRSIFNLSLARITKDLRLLRARIYGGINMRGMSSEGCLFMSDIIVRSPESVLWREATYFYPDYDDDNLSSASLLAAKNAEHDIAKLLWANDGEKSEACQVLERLGDEFLYYAKTDIETTDEVPFSQPLLYKLLTESRKGSDCAVRGEGMRIGGTINCKSGRFHGRVRMKYSHIESSVNFSGSRFTTPRIIIDNLKNLLDTCNNLQPLLSIEWFWKNACQDRESLEPSNRDEYVLDMQNCEIGGSLDLSRDSRNIIRDAAREKIISEVIGELCKTGEDPAKFYSIFYPKTGNPYDVNSEDRKKYNPFLEKLRKIGREVDPNFYQWERDSLQKRLAAKTDRAPGLISKHLDEPQTKKVIETIIDPEFGQVLSTIVLGEMIFTGIKVAGSFELNGVIFNWKGVDKDKSRIVMSHAEIGENLDFRDTVGLNTIFAEDTMVAGSIFFANKPLFITNKVGEGHDPFYGPLRRKAHLTYRAFSNPGSKFQYAHNFARSKIGGDGIFIFDRYNGPSLKLDGLKVLGDLLILPAIGGIELDREEISSIFLEAENRRKIGHVSWVKKVAYMLYPSPMYQHFVIVKEKISAIFRPEPKKEYLKLSYPKNRLDRKIEKDTWSDLEKLVKPFPSIDLRAAKCSEIMHPPSAWPQQDGLQIEGFDYERSNKIGPLSAPRKTWLQTIQEARKNRVGTITVFLSSLSPIAALVILTLFYPALYQNLNANVGGANVIVLILAISFVNYKITTILLTRPRKQDGHALAVEWLKLQTRRLNARKNYSAIVPWGPYSKAASVLRRTGRQRSADAVELKRLRERRKAMSYRSSILLKGLMYLTDLVTRYGFKPMRTAGIIFILIVGSSIYFHDAHRSDLIYPKDDGLWDHAVKIDGSRAQFKEPKNYTSRNRPSAYPRFDPLVLAIDVTLPFLDLNQEKYWSLKDEASSAHMRVPPSHCIIILKFLGWLLSGLIAVAIASRVETILARSENAGT